MTDSYKLNGGTPWRNRIIGHGEVNPEDLLANPNNWRIHPKRQQDALAGALNELGWIDDVTVNQATGFVLDGHARVALALRKGEATIPVKFIDLSEDEERLALATFDAITGMAETDAAKLDELLREVNTGEAALQEMLAELAESAGVYGEGAGEDDNNYSRKIEPPLYIPKGEKPTPAELYDDTRTRQLVTAIMEAEGLPDDVREFLIIAAQRHTVLRFNKIAEYYAHAAAPLQRLMEDSALVIIDFKRAIELGFVELTHNIADLVREEYGG